MRVAAIDSSCVIALDKIGIFAKTSVLFSRLLLPKAVRRELFRRRGMKNRVRRLAREVQFVESCDLFDQTVVDLMLLESHRVGWQDRGEAETVAQAAQASAMAVIDDPFGRKLAEEHRLECHGTLWILSQLYEQDFLTPSEVRAHLKTLAVAEYRLPQAAIKDLLEHLETT
jgi:predicted nucleic acid-binding protein